MSLLVTNIVHVVLEETDVPHEIGNIFSIIAVVKKNTHPKVYPPPTCIVLGVAMEDIYG